MLTSSSPSPSRVPTADDVYGYSRWGQGYVGVSDEGRVTIHPEQDPGRSIDLYRLVTDLRQQGLATPLLLRFPGILESRLEQIAQAFGRAIDELGYAGDYYGVYPIKVNQQRHIVQELTALGEKHGFGLEAGSKPELLAVMALVENPDTLIVCNGFKDRQFIEAVTLARKIGKNVIPIVEKFSELRLIIEQAKAHGVRPAIGVRIKLASAGAGRWQGSGGDRSKFGLFVSEALEAVRMLEAQGMLDCLQLVHFHLGSQVHDIRALKAALVEASRLYVELAKLGAGLRYLDVGGGLGVDYDGSKSGREASPNYTLAEYANNVVYHVNEVCRDAEIDAPTIITESGRAIAAHHSVLVMDVMGWSGFERLEPVEPLSDTQVAALPAPVHTLYETLVQLKVDNCREYFHDAQVAREQMLSAFSLGYCSLEQRGLAERLFYRICAQCLRLSRGLDPVPEEFAALETLLSDIYFCNASIFQSLPDSWAIDQLFPIMPIHRLDEQPTCRGVLADITCDSDGKIDRFIPPPQSTKASVPVLPMHPYTGDDYLLGVFLVGAYQEILGDLHNLFGDTNAAHVSIDADGQVHVEQQIAGDTIGQVLGYVQYDPGQLRDSFHQTLVGAAAAGRVTAKEADFLKRFYDQGLAGYTYLT